MNTGQVWKRLFIKEFRENWIYLLILFTLPPVLFSAAPHVEYDLQGFYIWMAGLVFAVVTPVWITNRIGREQDTHEFTQAHLPVPKIGRLAMAYLMPLLTAMIIGAWFGLCAMMPFMVSSIPFAVKAATLTAAAGVLTAYFLVTTLSKWVGLAISISVFLAGIDILITYIMFDISSRAYKLTAAQKKATFPDNLLDMHIIWALLIAAIAGTALLLLLRNRTKRRILQAATISAAVLSLIAVLFLTGEIGQSSEGQYSSYQALRIDSGDWSCYVAQSPGNNVTLEYGNLRTGQIIRKHFEPATTPIAFHDRTCVYLAQQGLGEKSVRILDWNVKTGQLTCLFSIPSAKDVLANRSWILNEFKAYLSPDNSHMLVSMQSALGEDSDLWLIDIKTHRKSLLLPNANVAVSQAAWGSQTAYLFGNYGLPIKIDLKKKTALILDPKKWNEAKL